VKRLPGLHRASIAGRAGADRGPLLLAGTVTALAVLLSSAVPTMLHRTADDAVRAAVRQAGADTSVVVSQPLGDDRDEDGNLVRPSHAAAEITDLAGSAALALKPGLAAVLRPPVASVTSTALTVGGHGPGRTLELAYLSTAARLPVVWTAGKAPAASVPAAKADSVIPSGPAPWPVQIGISEPTAVALGAGPGDRIKARTPNGKDLDVRISGVFRTTAADDPLWQVAPALPKPLGGSEGGITRVELGGLLTADSLPDARVAVGANDLTAEVTFSAVPGRFDRDGAEGLAAETVALRSTSGSSDGSGSSDNGPPKRWESQLDSVLRGALVQVSAAQAQASVLLVGLLAGAALVLLLAAQLLVRRRASVLTGTRIRGASLAGLGAELLLESSLVTLTAAGLGLLVSHALGQPTAWRWPVPVLAVAVLAGPLLSLQVAESATRGRQAAANRSARRSALRTGQLRRVSVEAVIVLATAAAFTALHQRGLVTGDAPKGGGQLLPALAPTLGAVVGALVLLRLVPLAVGLALAGAARSTRSLPLLAAARAAATAARPLPFVVLTVTSALVAFAFSFSATETEGQAAGAWRTVGADARVELPAGPAVSALAQRLSAANGVRQALAARVSDNVPVVADGAAGDTRLVVVDPAAFARLLANTPLPDAPQLARLTGSSPTVSALLRSPDGSIRPGHPLVLRPDDTTRITVTPVGSAPAVGDGEGNVLIVDAASFAAAGGAADPNTVWVLGPGAARAATTASGSAIDVRLRSQVLAERHDAPLAAGLLHLAAGSAGVLLLLGMLSILLGAAASATDRGETLARLRTLGLRPREARRMATAELLPPALIATVSGLAIGVLLAHTTLARLALRLLTGQSTDPALVVPWLTAVPVLLAGLLVIVVVGVESSVRRRERLGQVLRAGNG
jgi:putative ABC transport system permease protein